MVMRFNPLRTGLVALAALTVVIAALNWRSPAPPPVAEEPSLTWIGGTMHEPVRYTLIPAPKDPGSGGALAVVDDLILLITRTGELHFPLARTRSNACLSPPRLILPPCKPRLGGKRTRTQSAPKTSPPAAPVTGLRFSHLIPSSKQAMTARPAIGWPSREYLSLGRCRRRLRKAPPGAFCSKASPVFLSPPGSSRCKPRARWRLALRRRSC